MSRSTFGLRRSFNSSRKISRENRNNKHQQSAPRGNDHNLVHEKRQRSRHDNSDADKAARSIFGDVPLTDTERRYLWAAQSGNLPALEILLEEAGTFNLSCRDYLGRTALQLAVLGEHYDCIELLLDKSRLDVIEEGLLHAINSENVKICDMFLSHPVYSDQRSRTQLEFQHGFYEQEDSSSSFAPDITPIVLAAQCNNFDIVHMLIQKGFIISTPHNYFCLCTECCNHKNFDRVVHSKSRLNAYRGLASTAYLCLSCDDPIYAAFELSRSLQKLAEREKEHKNEYLNLSDKCKNFAVDLLDHCRTNEEVMAALHGGTDTRDLSRIKMAIRYEQKKFIAHASCQEHLASMWYSGASWFQHQNFPIKLIMVPCGIVFIPVTAIIYVFLPYSRIGKILKSPFMKFMNYICSYTAFLVLLFLGTQLSSFKSSQLFMGTEGIVNGLIVFYVLGMFWAECKQLWEEGVKGYFSQMWNYMDITMLALYTAGYSTEGVIYTKTRAYSSHFVHSQDESILNPRILSKVLFSVANVMSFARIAYILPASETFGQLQISYGRMLQDVGKFIFIYFTVMIAFICGLTSLYSISRNTHFSGLLETTGTLFWAAFGMGDSKAPEILSDDKEENTVTGQIRKENGQIMDRDHLAVIESVGYILYGVYILGAVVVLINMLIAMMSNTFEDIQKSEDCEWKFARAKLWISFVEQGTTLPIPFNVIPTPKSVLKLVRWLKDWMFCGEGKQNTEWPGKTQYDQKYKAIMHRVVLRYIHKMKFEKKGESLKDEILDTREELVFQLHSMYGRLAARLELMEKDLFALSESGYLSQAEAIGPSHTSLFYSRSVPTHPRDGTRATTSRFPADQPRESYLQRRRSCYNHGPRAEKVDGAGVSSILKTGRDSSLTGSSVSTAEDKLRRESDTRQSPGHTATTVAASTGSRDCNGSAGGDVTPADNERKISGASITFISLPDSERQARSWTECCTQRPGLEQGISQNSGGDKANMTRVSWLNTDETIRDGLTGDTSNRSSRRGQTVIKESSLEEQANSQGERKPSSDSRAQAGCGAWTPRDLSDGDLYSRIHQAYTDVPASATFSGEIIHPLITDDAQQMSASGLHSESSVDTLLRESRRLHGSYNFRTLSPDLEHHRLDCSYDSVYAVNKNNDSAIDNESDSMEQYIPHLSTVSQKHHQRPIIPNTSMDSSRCSVQNSESFLYTSQLDGQSGTSPPSLNSTSPENIPTKPERKIGQVNHVYLPESAACDLLRQGNKQNIQHEEEIFYTRESCNQYLRSKLDDHGIDHVTRNSKVDFNDVVNQPKTEFANINNKHSEMQPQTLSATRMVSSVNNSTQILPAEDAIYSQCACTANLSAGFGQKMPSPNRGIPCSSFMREKYKQNSDLCFHANPSSELQALIDPTASKTQLLGCSSHRHSPLRKRESLPVITMVSKHHRILHTGHDYRPRYSIPTVPVSDRLSPSALTSGRGQRFRCPSDFEQTTAPEDVMTQMSNMSSACMVIPPMATNLVPFPVPTQSKDTFSSKQQFQPYSCSTKQTQATDGNKEPLKQKTPRSKKNSIVTFVRGRRSSKMSKPEIKHNRSLSLSRYSSESRSERLKKLQQQTSKEV